MGRTGRKKGKDRRGKETERARVEWEGDRAKDTQGEETE